MARQSESADSVGALAATGGSPGRALAAAGGTFFLGSAVLFQSGDPGASTPVPWMASHVLWTVAAALATAGTVSLLRRFPAVREQTASLFAAGAFGLTTLHVLQWSTWVYVDVLAYRQGAHGSLFDPLLHPFGTGHALMYGVLLGTGVAALGWGLARSGIVRRALAWAGVAVGAVTALAGTTALVTFADAPDPAGVATVLSLAASNAWLLVVGLFASR